VTSIQKISSLVKHIRYWGFPNFVVDGFAFIKKDFHVFCENEEGIVNSIYFDKSVDTNVELFSSTVLELSIKYDLVLLDWWLSDIYKTQHLNEINRFHDRYKE
jgi:hypothetical protein